MRPLDGEGEFFTNYPQQAEPRCQVSNGDLAKRASALLLQVDTDARKVCMTAESDVIVRREGVKKILDLLRIPFTGKL